MWHRSMTQSWSLVRTAEYLCEGRWERGGSRKPKARKMGECACGLDLCYKIGVLCLNSSDVLPALSCSVHCLLSSIDYVTSWPPSPSPVPHW